MSRRVSDLAQRVENAVKKCPQVTSTNLGRPKWCRGRSVLKVSNGMKDHLLVQICEKDGQHDMHVYTKNCIETTAVLRSFAEQENISFIKR